MKFFINFQNTLLQKYCRVSEKSAALANLNATIHRHPETEGQHETLIATKFTWFQTFQTPCIRLELEVTEDWIQLQ
jgi:hypothetical protein